MDKAQLFMMLAQQAPRLLAALKGAGEVPAPGFEEIAPPTNFPHIEEAVERGWDLPSLEQDVEYLGLGDANKLLGYDMHGKSSTEGWFPSDYGVGDAKLSASRMLEQNPSIGLPTTYEGAEVIGGDDDDLSNVLIDPTPLTEEESLAFDPKKKLFKKLTNQ